MSECHFSFTVGVKPRYYYVTTLFYYKYGGRHHQSWTALVSTLSLVSEGSPGIRDPNGSSSVIAGGSSVKYFTALE